MFHGVEGKDGGVGIVVVAGVLVNALTVFEITAGCVAGVFEDPAAVGFHQLFQGFGIDHVAGHVYGDDAFDAAFMAFQQVFDLLQVNQVGGRVDVGKGLRLQ